MPRDENLRVVAAAVRFGEGDDLAVFTMVPPARHCTLLWRLRKLMPGVRIGLDEQGFLLSNGAYCQRQAAAHVAVKAGQLSKPRWPPNLYSEDLW